MHWIDESKLYRTHVTRFLNAKKSWEPRAKMCRYPLSLVKIQIFHEKSRFPLIIRSNWLLLHWYTSCKWTVILSINSVKVIWIRSGAGQSHSFCSEIHFGHNSANNWHIDMGPTPFFSSAQFLWNKYVTNDVISMKIRPNDVTKWRILSKF